MSQQQVLKKWWQVYSGDKEKRFFVGADGKSGLVRKQDYNWRSTDKLASEANLSKAEVEQIIDKYHKVGMVVQHAKDPEKWGYWENVATQIGNQSKKSLVEDDQDKRIDKAKKTK